MPETGSTARQWELIRRWLAELKEIPALDVVWLEGSLADGRGTPYSDIDIRFAIADEEYEQLWPGPTQQENDATDPLEARGPTRLLDGLGEYLLLETAFVRALTSDGMLVEAGGRFLRVRQMGWCCMNGRSSFRAYLPARRHFAGPQNCRRTRSGPKRKR